MWKKNIDSLVDGALKEDMPAGDITSENIIPPESISEAIILAKEDGILAGIYVAKRVFEKIDPSISFRIHRKDGEEIKRGDKLAVLKGPSISLLKGERTALNFLQRLSGIATETSKFSSVLKNTKTKVLDTRKTTPGLRKLEKYAVKMGGGENHRLNLSEMVMIKDNHLKIIGSISEAIRLAKKRIKSGIRVEVEATSLKEVKEAVKCGADIIMLDNMPLNEMKDAVDWISGRVPVEVSGNVTLSKAKKIAQIGVDFISVGALTHSYKSLDISMELLG
jgi:nicotinate-nucleotide pyrophosphorylase (carboxylating)